MHFLSRPSRVAQIGCQSSRETPRKSETLKKSGDIDVGKGREPEFDKPACQLAALLRLASTSLLSFIRPFSSSLLYVFTSFQHGSFCLLLHFSL
jgi:hypothetical protein